jgi:hypothetical protein
MKRIYLLALLPALLSCKTPTQRWLDGLEKHAESHDKTLSLEAVWIRPQDDDTSSVTYKIRLYPSREWLDRAGNTGATELNYRQDSSFLLRQGKHDFAPVLFQPVNNGIAGSFEYLVSFDLVKAMQAGRLQLVYHDRFISGKPYTLNLHATP